MDCAFIYFYNYALFIKDEKSDKSPGNRELLYADLAFVKLCVWAFGVDKNGGKLVVEFFSRRLFFRAIAQV